MALPSDRGTSTSNVSSALKKVTNAVQSAASGRSSTPGSAVALGSQLALASQNTTPSGTSTSGTSKSGTGAGTGTKKVTYIGNNGAKASGTTKKKKTAAPVEAGTTPDYYTQMKDFYQNMYDEQVAANNAALEAARLHAQETTDAQIAALADQYQGTNRQLYRDYMNSRRVLPQQMAAQGYSGGLTESSMLRLNNAYMEGLNENERARLAQVTGYNQALAQQLYDAQARANEANTQAGQQRYSNLAAIEEAIYQDAQQRAATMAASGDFTEYKNLGYSDSEIAYLKKMWKKMNPKLK